MSRIYFTSDLHFGHEKVAGLRGFDSTEAHDDALCENWEASIRPRDTVYVLGDLAASSPTHALSLLRQLPGTKRLIAGNHDPIHPMHSKSDKWHDDYRLVFQSVSIMGEVSFAGGKALLSHFPYETDRHEPRHLQWRPRNYGMPLLHGHLHVAERRTSSNELHVGVDAWGLFPVTREELEEEYREAQALASLRQAQQKHDDFSWGVKVVPFSI